MKLNNGVHKVRILLDGQDITDRCCAFDTANGTVGVLEREGDRFAVDPASGRWKRTALFGRVEVVSENDPQSALMSL